MEEGEAVEDWAGFCPKDVDTDCSGGGHRSVDDALVADGGLLGDGCPRAVSRKRFDRECRHTLAERDVLLDLNAVECSLFRKSDGE